MKPNWAMITAAYLAREVHFRTRIRIRQWGHLPARRGPTVLVTNHQHVDEGEHVTRRAFLRHPWKGILMCNSRRTFETGFIAARMPWTASFTRSVNLSGLWARFNILPIENHLSSRPLISFAEEIRAAHGNVPLERVLPPEILTELGLTGRSVSELWTPELFAKAQAWVKLSRLLEPYRHEALANVRATAGRDIAAIVERVCEGATFYVTPEGDFSRDGRMHPMRNGITDAVLPFAEPWLSAIAYDPFRSGRLSMLYRHVRPANPKDLGTSLAAARPVTTSAVLGAFLIDGGSSFTAASAHDAVRRQLEALPPNVFVDPELRDAPWAVVNDALATLEERGTLQREEAGAYRLTEQRADERFPHVADMVSYQRNMLEETLDAASRVAG